MNARLLEIDDNEYEDYLNEVCGKINICGNEYETGDILRQIDPVAFQVGKDNYEDSRDNIWICDECNTEYDNKEDAESCCDWIDSSVIGTSSPIVQVFAIPSVDALVEKKKKSKPWIVNLP